MSGLEYTGQCWGGPDQGNLITSTVPEVAFHARYTYRLDGPDGVPSVVDVEGWYVWTPEGERFLWYLGPRPPSANRPTGPAVRRTWGTVDVGWFVKAPGGELYEVAEVTPLGGDRVAVTLLMPHGRHTFERDGRPIVWAKRGTLAPADPIGDAVDALEAAGFRPEVISDQLG